MNLYLCALCTRWHEESFSSLASARGWVPVDVERKVLSRAEPGDLLIIFFRIVCDVLRCITCRSLPFRVPYIILLGVDICMSPGSKLCSCCALLPMFCRTPGAFPCAHCPWKFLYVLLVSLCYLAATWEQSKIFAVIYFPSSLLKGHRAHIVSQGERCVLHFPKKRRVFPACAIIQQHFSMCRATQTTRTLRFEHVRCIPRREQMGEHACFASLGYLKPDSTVHKRENGNCGYITRARASSQQA